MLDVTWGKPKEHSTMYSQSDIICWGRREYWDGKYVLEEFAQYFHENRFIKQKSLSLTFFIQVGDVHIIKWNSKLTIHWLFYLRFRWRFRDIHHIHLKFVLLVNTYFVVWTTRAVLFNWMRNWFVQEVVFSNEAHLTTFVWWVIIYLQTRVALFQEPQSFIDKFKEGRSDIWVERYCAMCFHCNMCCHITMIVQWYQTVFAKFII